VKKVKITNGTYRQTDQSFVCGKMDTEGRRKRQRDNNCRNYYSDNCSVRSAAYIAGP